MASSGELTGADRIPPRGRKRQSSVLLVVAASLLLFAAAVGVTFFLLRPVTYRDPDGREVVFAPFVFGVNEPGGSSTSGKHEFPSA